MDVSYEADMREKEKNRVFICVDRDKLTGGIQVSIDDDSSGYRIAGPKYCGMSERLKTCYLTYYDVEEIRKYLNRIPKES